LKEIIINLTHITPVTCSCSWTCSCSCWDSAASSLPLRFLLALPPSYNTPVSTTHSSCVFLNALDGLFNAATLCKSIKSTCQFLFLTFIVTLPSLTRGKKFLGLTTTISISSNNHQHHVGMCEEIKFQLRTIHLFFELLLSYAPSSSTLPSLGTT